ncbi:MAG: DUF2062 domain-containing protein [Chthoniobacter sp.]|uniref:DUF2062 domain-containing protein n=1 Tax=Chthoniobacter sp. TaxID=2510640 RepID=UPI0032AAEB86
MNPSEADPSVAAVPPAASFWQRRVVTPIVNQLKQGITPEKIALTIALGLLLSIFPILGATTILCALAAFALRLNQPIIQLINYLSYPLQLAFLIPFYRAGEHLLGRAPVRLNIPLLFQRFGADVRQFFLDFGMIAVGGILAWLIVAPFAVACIYYIARPLLRALATRIRPSLETTS